jgi:uncharacterized membrane protein
MQTKRRGVEGVYAYSSTRLFGYIGRPKVIETVTVLLEVLVILVVVSTVLSLVLLLVLVLSLVFSLVISWALAVCRGNAIIRPLATNAAANTVAAI